MTELTRQQRLRLINGIDDAISYGAAVANATKSLKRGAAAVAAHITKLRKKAIAEGISQQAIDDFLAELDLTPSEIKASLGLLNGPDLPELPPLIIRIKADRSRFADPGRIHAGGSIRKDEPLVTGKRGERVRSLREWRRLRKQRRKGES